MEVTIQDNQRCVIIVMGIGKRVESETILRREFPKKCQFYGADPDPNPNKALFEGINGTYFGAAIGARTEVKKAFLLTG